MTVVLTFGSYKRQSGRLWFDGEAGWSRQGCLPPIKSDEITGSNHQGRGDMDDVQRAAAKCGGMNLRGNNPGIEIGVHQRSPRPSSMMLWESGTVLSP